MKELVILRECSIYNMIKAVTQFDKNGQFAKGNTIGNRGSNGTRNNNVTGKMLRELCLDVLHSQTIGGMTIIEKALQDVARDKPEALLPFASKMMPQDIEVVATKASPIVFSMEAVVEQPIPIEIKKEVMEVDEVIEQRVIEHVVSKIVLDSEEEL